MDKLVNLASLTKDEALALARAGGRAILGDVHAVTHVYHDLMSHWLARSMPQAVGQSDDEFGDLVEAVEREFNAGAAEAVSAAREDEKRKQVIERIDDLLTDQTAIAFKMQGLLQFMVEALPDDSQGRLPVKCTLTHLRDDMMQLAENLMDLVREAEHG
ncbi:hypothetical protein [Paraburkholderia bryophila]|uniref:Uncharacterized protein n=1 Tax=Paraburkholderia bryophila TaxID=420952 RepID=A0A329D214_9BURK|nr:hypothetical protein [Paraburkholderia bryophila]RAS38304.1 hypothetical protein BX591_102600 [Paraburkholderia bryophila]